jgi:hypothetical protein
MPKHSSADAIRFIVALIVGLVGAYLALLPLTV